MKIKNLRIVAGCLCLGATLLTGCGVEKLTVGNSNLIIEDGETTGSISYEDLNQYSKIVTFEHDNKANTYLLIKKNITYDVDIEKYHYKHIIYYDLKTGSCIINYRDYYNTDNIDWVLGEELNIKEEQDISSYLVTENYIKKEYTIEEILTFFEEKIKPTLVSSEKELIK